MSRRPPPNAPDRSTADDEPDERGRSTHSPRTSEALSWLQHDVDRVRTLLRHDGREPLHVLSLYSRLLADDPDTERFGRPIHDATEEIRDLFTTIETWLALGPPDPGPADPVALARAAGSRPGIEVVLPSDPLLVAMRPRHLRHAFDALLELATPLDEAAVTVVIDSTSTGSDPNAHVRIAITPSRPTPADQAALAIPQRLIDSAGGHLVAHEDQRGWTLLLPPA